MSRKILQFRRLKTGGPEKLKVLAEDLPRPAWLDRISMLAFALLVLTATTGVFGGVWLALGVE